jgi:hypothetical protein
MTGQRESDTVILPEVLDIIRERYRMVDVIDIFLFMHDVEGLARRLHTLQGRSFQADERLIILHDDTDYYPSTHSSGFQIYNLLRLCANFDISLEHMIVLTNHYGIQAEIQRLSQEICNSAGPRVVCTSQWIDYPELGDLPDPPPVDPGSRVPEYLYCCLNNKQRQHRLLTLCMLQEADLIQQGMISWHFEN